MVFKGYFSPMPVLNCLFKYILIALFLFSWTFQSPQWLHKTFYESSWIYSCLSILSASQRPPKTPHTRWVDTFSSPILCCSSIGLNRLKVSQEFGEKGWPKKMKHKCWMSELVLWLHSWQGLEAAKPLESHSKLPFPCLKQSFCLSTFILCILFVGGRHTSSKKSKLRPSFEFALWFKHWWFKH